MVIQQYFHLLRSRFPCTLSPAQQFSLCLYKGSTVTKAVLRASSSLQNTVCIGTISALTENHCSFTGITECKTQQNLAHCT